MGNLQIRMKKAYEDLCLCQTNTLMNPSQDLMVMETLTYNRWKQLSDLEEMFLHQKSKLHWLQFRDGNNRYFHQATRKCELRNSIHCIKKQDGTLVDTQIEIKAGAEHYFQNVLTLSVPDFRGINEENLKDLLGFVCNEEDGEQLTKTVTEEEIKHVLFAMPGNKSPGPDGFTVEFFKET